MKIRIDFSVTIKPPTERQLRYANAIAEALELDFPQSSKDFTFDAYFAFISEHVAEYKRFCRDAWDDDAGRDWDAWIMDNEDCHMMASEFVHHVGYWG